jgi:hypothetical protein
MRNVFERFVSRVFTIYRCLACQTRQAKLRWIKVETA